MAGLLFPLSLVVTLHDSVVLGEWGDESHGFQSTVDISGSRVGVPESFEKLVVDPFKLGAEFCGRQVNLASSGRLLVRDQQT